MENSLGGIISPFSAGPFLLHTVATASERWRTTTTGAFKRADAPTGALFSFFPLSVFPALGRLAQTS